MLFMTHRDDNNGRGAKRDDGIDEDTLLVRAAQSGDIRAFEKLIRRYERLVYRTAFYTVGNDEDAADLTQEILLKLWHGLPHFQGNARFLTWFAKIMRNTCYDYLRKKKRSHPTQSLDMPSDQDEDRPCQEIQDASSDVDPYEVLCRRECASVVRAAMQKLSEEHRAVILLRDIEGASYETIAGMLGLEVGTVKSRLSRARAHLKSILRAEDFFK